MSNADLAGRVFDAQREMSMAESALEDALFDLPSCNCFGTFNAGSFTDWRFDDYDASIEFDECDDAWRLTVPNLEQLWAVGFLRCWLNHDVQNIRNPPRLRPRPGL